MEALIPSERIVFSVLVELAMNGQPHFIDPGPERPSKQIKVILDNMCVRHRIFISYSVKLMVYSHFCYEVLTLGRYIHRCTHLEFVPYSVEQGF